MLEHSEKGVMDADVHINYKTKEIKFEKKVGGNIYLYSLLWLIGITVFMIGLPAGISYFSTTYPRIIYDTITGESTVYQTVWDYYKPTSMIIPILTIWGFIVLFIGFESGGFPWMREWMFKNKRKFLCGYVEILNPSGTIVYKFRSGEPLIDMEYNDDIANALSECSLVKEKVDDKKKDTNKIMVLKIVLERPATGTLKIFEY